MTLLRGRTRDSSWQWLLIGIVLGMGCMSVVCLGAYAANLIVFNFQGQLVQVVGGNTTPTPLPAIVVTATLDPEKRTPTVPPTQPTTPQPTSVLIIQPSANPPTASGSFVGQGNTPLPIPTSPGTPHLIITTGANPVEPIASPPSFGGSETPSAASVTLTDVVFIQGGAFTMGTDLAEATRAIQDCEDRDKGTNCNIQYTEDSFPPHPVTVNSFQIEIYEVSHEQYIAFLNALGPNSHLNGCGGQPCAAVQGGPGSRPTAFIRFDGKTYSLVSDIYRNRPITNVTWYGADAYCRSIGRRLPTEAEWERAARGTEGRLYPWGNAWDNALARTSRPQNVGGPDDVNTYRNGATPEGVYNLAGNVAEWLLDWYSENYYKQVQPNAIDPRGPTAGTRKVARGGSWDALPLFARSVHRQEADPLIPNVAIGFRCAVDTTPGAANPGTGGNAGAAPGTQATPFFPVASPTAGALNSGSRP